MAYCTQSNIADQISQAELIQLTDDRPDSLLPSTTLNGAITASVTLITLTDSSKFSAAGRVRIGNEEIDYTANAFNILSGCTRGANDTIAIIHANLGTVTEIHRIDSSVITAAIADADNMIDSYCSAQYDIPFSTTPGILKKISVDLAIYNLFSRRRGASEHRKNNRDEAIKFLKDVANGLVSLGSELPAHDEDAGPEASTNIDDRIFSRGRTSDSFVGTLDNF